MERAAQGDPSWEQGPLLCVAGGCGRQPGYRREKLALSAPTSCVLLELPPADLLCPVSSQVR